MSNHKCSLRINSDDSYKPNSPHSAVGLATGIFRRGQTTSLPSRLAVAKGTWPQAVSETFHVLVTTYSSCPKSSLGNSLGIQKILKGGDTFWTLSPWLSLWLVRHGILKKAIKCHYTDRSQDTLQKCKEVLERNVPHCLNKALHYMSLGFFL